MAEYKIEISNQWSIVSGNTWVDISDYLVANVNIPRTARNEDYTPLFNDINLQLQDRGVTYQKGDRIRISLGTVGFFQGYIKTSIFDEDKRIYKVAVQHWLSKLKEKKVNDIDWPGHLADDKYNDSYDQVFYVSGSPHLLTSYSLRGIILACILTACPNMYTDFDVLGTRYYTSSASFDLYSLWFCDRAMLLNLGGDRAGFGYIATQEFKDGCSTLYDFVSAICKLSGANIFTENNQVIFNGIATETSTIFNQSYYNDSMTHTQDNSKATKYMSGYKNLEKKYYYKPETLARIVEYYVGGNLPLSSEFYLPTQVGNSTGYTKTWKNLNIPTNLLVYNAYLVGSDIEDIANNTEFWTPLSLTNSFVLQHLYSRSFNTDAAFVPYINNETMTYIDDQFLTKKNVLREDISITGNDITIKQITYEE